MGIMSFRHHFYLIILLISAALVCILNAWPAIAGSNWFVEEWRFHSSVHGQLSCADCHADISESSRHPDPMDVNRPIGDFFNPETCYACHEEVIDEISEGNHGQPQSLTLAADARCIDCHDPHYQAAPTDATPAGVSPIVKEKQCDQCHAAKTELPVLPADDAACMTCHRHASLDAPDTADKHRQLCMACHSSVNKKVGRAGGVAYPVIDAVAYETTAHRGISCLACHQGAASFAHRDQKTVDCRSCHTPHGIATTHAPHLRTSCRACHMKTGEVALDHENQMIVWQAPGDTENIHALVPKDGDEACRRCHFQGNTPGAAAMVLPAPGVTCLPCHAGTLSVGNAITALALSIFTLGLLAVGSVWFTGGGTKKRMGHRRSFPNVVGFIRAIIVDGLLQRRLLMIGFTRWVFHGLIVWSITIRFVFGMAAVIATAWWADNPLAWAMIDRNHPVTAFLHDMTGLAILVGLIGMYLLKRHRRRSQEIAHLPRIDIPAYLLLAGIVLIGFLLEGMRIHMTAVPLGSTWSLIGYPLSWLFSGLAVTDLYGYVWYGHAILTGALVAYLPFSRLFHIIMAPFALAVTELAGDHHSASPK